MNFQERLIQIAAFLLPLFIVPIPEVADQFYFPKAIILWSIGTLLLVSILIGNRPSLPKWVFITIGIIFLTTLISAFFSDHQQIVWDGLLWRHEGVFTILSYIVIFICSVNFRKRNLDKLFISIVLAGSIAGLIGLLQYYKFDILPKDGIRENWTRIYATIGNANWLASFLLITFPISIYFVLKNKNALSIIASFIITSCLFSTGSRSAFLALTLSILIVLLIKRKVIISNYKQLVPPLGIFLFSFLITNIPNNYPLQRIMSMESNIRSAIIHDEPSAGEYRWYIFSETVKMIPSHLVIGSGPDTFGKVFNQESLWHKMKEDGFEKSRRVKLHKAHNEYLQLTITIGLIGALAFAILTFGILFQLLKLQDTLSLVLALSLMPVMIQLCFTNSSIGSMSAFWIAMGIGTSIIHPQIKHQLNFQ